MVPRQGAPPGPLGAPCSRAVGLAAGLSKQIFVAQSHWTHGCAQGYLVTATPQHHHTAPTEPPPSRGAGRRVAVGTPARVLPPAAPCSSPRSAGGGGVVLGAVVCATQITSAHTGRDLHGTCTSLCCPRARAPALQAAPAPLHSHLHLYLIYSNTNIDNIKKSSKSQSGAPFGG